jgi:hypothetical protein
MAEIPFPQPMPALLRDSPGPGDHELGWLTLVDPKRAPGHHCLSRSRRRWEDRRRPAIDPCGRRLAYAFPLLLDHRLTGSRSVASALPWCRTQRHPG